MLSVNPLTIAYTCTWHLEILATELALATPAVSDPMVDTYHEK